MGFVRNIGRSALTIALSACACGAGAEPREVLLVTELHEPILVPLSGIEDSREKADDPTARFSLAIAQALASDRRTMDQACRSGAPKLADHSASFDWQANCLYRRR
jgi:hypothetical protein